MTCQNKFQFNGSALRSSRRRQDFTTSQQSDYGEADGRTTWPDIVDALSLFRFHFLFDRTLDGGRVIICCLIHLKHPRLHLNRREELCSATGTDPESGGTSSVIDQTWPAGTEGTTSPCRTRSSPCRQRHPMHALQPPHARAPLAPEYCRLR